MKVLILLSIVFISGAINPEYTSDVLESFMELDVSQWEWWRWAIFFISSSSFLIWLFLPIEIKVTGIKEVKNENA